MIKVTFKPNQKGIKIEGHAGFAEHGQDIVCAGVSALTQTFLYGFVRNGHPSYQMSQGFFDLDMNTHNDVTRAMLDALRLGLLSMADVYPENIKIIEL